MTFTIDQTRVACATATGTQDITISGFGTPVAAIFIPTFAQSDGAAAAGAVLSFGFTDGTRNRCIVFEEEDAQASSDPGSGASTADIIRITDGTGGNVADGLAQFSAWITDGVRINWSNAPTNAYLMTVILIGGTDASAHVNNATIPTSVDGTLDITAPGFEPDAIIALANVSNGFSIGVVHNNRAGTVTQMSSCFVVRAGRPTMENNASVRDAYGLHEVTAVGSLDWALEFGTFDSSGFTITNRLATSTRTMYYLAIRLGTTPVVAAKVYMLSTPTGTGSANDTGAGFTPQWIFGITSLVETVNSAIVDANAGGIGILSVAAGSQYHVTVSSEDGAGDSNTQSLNDNQAVNQPLGSGAAGLAATFTEFISTGVTYNWSDIETAAKKWPTLAIEAFSAGTQYNQSVAGTVTPDGALARQTGKPLAGTISPAGALILQAGKILDGALTSAGALVLQARKVLGGTITPDGALAAVKIALIALGGTLNSAGALVLQTGKAVAGSIAPDGGLIRQAAKGLAGTIAPDGGLIKRTAKTMAGTITPAGVLAAVKIALMAVAGTLGLAGDLAKQTDKTVSGSLPSSGAISKAISKIVSGGLSGTGSISKAISKGIGGTLGLAGSLAGVVSAAVEGIVALTARARSAATSALSRIASWAQGRPEDTEKQDNRSSQAQDRSSSSTRKK